jgi:hypothetical protein
MRDLLRLLVATIAPGVYARHVLRERRRRAAEAQRLVDARYRSARLARADVRRYPHVIDGEVAR